MNVAIITPAQSHRLTTVEHVRMDLAGTVGAATDIQILRCIDQASSQAERFCCRSFGVVTYRECLPRCSATRLMLARWPAVGVLSLTIGGVEVDVATYTVDEDGILLADSGAVVASMRDAVVVYEAGWLLPGQDRDDSTAAQDLPADVEQAVILMVGAMLSAAGRDVMVKGETVEGIGRTDYYVQGASAQFAHPEVEPILRRYRKAHLG